MYLLTCVQSDKSPCCLHEESLHPWPFKMHPVKILSQLHESPGRSESFLMLLLRFKANTMLAKQPGPNCSKLMMLLVNVLLKLWSLNMAYTLIFLLKNVSSICICKCYSHFFSKYTCELDRVLTRTVNILTTNELVKLIGPTLYPNKNV